MKILLSNPVRTEGPFHHWMTADLRALGHDVSTIDPDDLAEQFGVELYRRVLLRRVAAERPDVVWVYPPYDLLRGREAAAVRGRGAVVVGFAYDDPIFLPAFTRSAETFAAILAEYRRTYDLYLTTSRQMVAAAAVVPGPGGAGAWLRHIRWACGTPPPAPPAPAVARDVQVVLVGTPYPRRVEMVRHLLRAGVRPVVHGPDGWRRVPDVAKCYGGLLTRAGMFDAYRRARIALAPADWESQHTPMVKLRSVEIASCGPLQLCEACEDLADYFRDGEEVVAYSSWDDLAAKVKHFLSDEGARARVALAGYERTCREHVWSVRWGEVQAMLQRLRDDGPRGGRTGSTADMAGGPGAGPDVAGGDPDLPRELGWAASADHFERAGDYRAAAGIYDDWVAARPDCFTARLGRGRVGLALGRADEAERDLDAALAASAGLCNLGRDVPGVQRVMGPRLGLGRLLRGVFPRRLECQGYRLITAAVRDDAGGAERALADLAGDPDHLAMALLAVLAEHSRAAVLPLRFVDCYAGALLAATPGLVSAELDAHRARVGLMRAQALASMSRRGEARRCLREALARAAEPAVKREIQQALAALG